MNRYTPAWPHSNIEEIFPNIFFVTGTNKTSHNGINLQFSRNMIIVRNKDELTLINTVRLQNSGLRLLESLGKVVNIIRIGAFHGRDDAFYLDSYNAKLWALPNMFHENGKITDIELVENGVKPFPNCSLFKFDLDTQIEGILHIAQEGGILISCDSLQNWTKIDQYFSVESGKYFLEHGLIKSANISYIWKQACNPKINDFVRLKSLSFCHLLSAHGEPLISEAYKKLVETFRQQFGI